MSSHPTSSEPQNDLWGPDWPEVRSMWPLEPTVAHLNHGSFGAVPTPVLEEQQSWRDRMESNPVRFLARELPGALEQARAEVAPFLGTDVARLAFVRNATTGVNTVLSCTVLEAGDEILLTDHAYGAVRLAAQRWAEARSAQVVVAPVPLDGDADAAADAVLGKVGERTRLAVLEQVTSPTAHRMPLVSLAPALRERGVRVLVDGAHAPGMLDVDLDALGVDFWTGNLHKWAFAPRGTGVLFASEERRAELRPLVTSWGEPAGFPDSFDQVGTDDQTPWLAAPRGLRLLAQLDADRVRRHNVELAVRSQRVIAQGLGLAPDELPRDPAVSMQLVPLPRGRASDEVEAAALQQRIAEQLGVEVAVTTWRRHGFLRLSAQVYNCPADYARLGQGLGSLL